jgi:hypothetical protein
MTIGPAPMIRIEEMSVRFGIEPLLSGRARRRQRFSREGAGIKKARGRAS